MSEVINFLQTGEEPMTISNDPVNGDIVLSSNSVLSLDDIDIVNYNDTVTVSDDINTRFSNIDSNFKRLVQSDYLRGKPGANYTSKHIFFAKNDPNREGEKDANYKNPTIYNMILSSANSSEVMDNTYIVKGIRNAILDAKGLSSSKPTGTDPAKDTFWEHDKNSTVTALKHITNSEGTEIHWHDNIASGLNKDYNIFTFITEEVDGKIAAYSSLVYIFTDKRFEYITDSNKEQYAGLTDMSCAIYYTYNTKEVESPGGGNYYLGQGSFKAVNTFPTLSYNTDGNFYWNVYGSDTGLLAQGPKGDAASSAMIYCTYSPIKDATKYVKLEDVFVTYIGDNGKETTSFLPVNEAVSKGYINLDAAKNQFDHVKICAFCVPKDSPVDENGKIIMGTVCYSENVSKSNNGEYVVRFDDQLSFNHLFNQYNFFNIMLRNYVDNEDSPAINNGYGVMFIPMSDAGVDSLDSTPAHTISAGRFADNNTLGSKPVLNIIPVDDINNLESRKKLISVNNYIPDIDSVALADCPMNVYYDVNLINKNLSFKTNQLTIKDGETIIYQPQEYNRANPQTPAQLDLKYHPEIVYKNGKYTAEPSLEVDCNWSGINVNASPVEVKPSVDFNGLSLLLKYKDSTKQGILDYIKDLTNKEAQSNWSPDYNTSSYYSLVYRDVDQYKNSSDVNDKESVLGKFHLSLVLGSIGEKGEDGKISVSVDNCYLQTPYYNYAPMLFSWGEGGSINYSAYAIHKNSTAGLPYNNLYLYGSIYPRLSPVVGDKLNKTDELADKNRTDAFDVTYKTYIDIYNLTDRKGLSNRIAQTNFIHQYLTYDTAGKELKCPNFSLYRDYRSGHTLSMDSGNNSSTFTYTRTNTEAEKSHPLDYGTATPASYPIGKDPDTEPIASHEGGVVYPHKLILAEPSFVNKEHFNGGEIVDLRTTTHRLNKTIKNPSDAQEKYENYGSCIARIDAPLRIKTDGSTSGIKLDHSYFGTSQNSQNAWNFNIKFDKLIAPIINIRSNAYASPGMDFSRGICWNNSGLYLASFNVLNTGLAINKASHSLSYRLVYKLWNDANGDVDATEYKTSNISIPSSKVVQNIQTGLCGNTRRVFFDKPYESGAGQKTIRENSPMMGQLCDPTLMTRMAYPIAYERYYELQKDYGRNDFGGSSYLSNDKWCLGTYNSKKFDANLNFGNISPIGRYALHVHRNRLQGFMYGADWLYTGGNLEDNTQLPFGESTIVNIAKYSTTNSPSNPNGIMNGKKAFKLFGKEDACTPNNSLYNIGLYPMVYKDSNNKLVEYTGNDGYRTITLPYSPNNCEITIDAKTFESAIPADHRSTAVVTAIEIMYNCEVVFDTLLDVISGNVYSDTYDWDHAVDVYGDSYGSGLDVFITDAVPHAKFLKHDLIGQIQRLYAPSEYDTGGSSSRYNHIWDFRPSKNVALDTELKDVEECYSGYRGITHYVSGDYHVDHTGAGYCYATKYDLDSYYNRAFINPYHYTAVKADGTGVVLGNLNDNNDATKIYNLTRNFRADDPIGRTDTDSKKFREGYGLYRFNGLSLNPIDGHRSLYKTDKASIGKMFNHAPYFIGVGVIEMNDVSDTYDFKNGNNKGIVYLCHKDDTAYTVSNTSVYQELCEQSAEASAFKRRYDVILEDNINTDNVYNIFRGFNALLMRNNIDYDNGTRNYMSPFFRSFGPNEWCATRGYGTLISDQKSDKTLYGFDSSDLQKQLDALNIIDYWYPKSTDIFNNPHMFVNPVRKSANYENGSGTSYRLYDNVAPNVGFDDISNNESLSSKANTLSDGFNLDNIKLAWRKFNIKTKSKGYYDGHTVEFGEYTNESNSNTAKLSMLNITETSGQFVSDVNQTFFIKTDNNNIEDGCFANLLKQATPSGGSSEEVEINTDGKVDSHICRDGIIWKDDNSNYVAIHMTGSEKSYKNINFKKSDEVEGPLSSDKLPETKLYISKNGTKAVYAIDFTQLLLAAGSYLTNTQQFQEKGQEVKFIQDMKINDDGTITKMTES